MARRKKKKRGTPKIPLTFVAAGAGTVLSPGKATWGGCPMDSVMGGQWRDAANHLKMGFLGLEANGQLAQDPQNAFQYLKMWAIAVLVHKFVGGWPLNLNRSLARYKLPFSI